MVGGGVAAVGSTRNSKLCGCTSQIPTRFLTATLPAAPAYTAPGNATPRAKWTYCCDRNDTDTRRGNVTGSANGNNWNCAVTGSQNAADPDFPVKPPYAPWVAVMARWEGPVVRDWRFLCVYDWLGACGAALIGMLARPYIAKVGLVLAPMFGTDPPRAPLR